MLYGGLKPALVLGQEEFAKHDATKTWDDGGVAVELAADVLRNYDDAITEALEHIRRQGDELRDSLANDFHSYGAHQVRDAVVDYLGSSEFFLTLYEGELYIVIDGSNDQATFQPLIKLDQLLMRAKLQAQQQGDVTFLARMADLVSALPRIAAHLAENPEPAPAAPGRLRQAQQQRASVTAARVPGKRLQGGTRGAAAR